jgi:Family of unknown function (DUF5343)
MEGAAMTEDLKQNAAVYVGWASFKNALEQLSQSLPNRLDRSAFPTHPWGVQSQLLAGLRFLGLIDTEGVPTPELHQLAVPDEEERKRQLARIMRERYADLFALDLTKATPAQVSEKMGDSYRAVGDTREKAVRFFLSATDYLGIPKSPLLKSKSSANGGSPRKKKGGKKGRAQAETLIPPAAPPAIPEAGTARVFKLHTPGGELTISTKPGFLALVAADRRLIFDLMDQVEAHETKAPSGQSQTNAGGEE